MTLAELGQRCGHSASQISRYERGVQPLTDITLLRRFARALAIPPQVLGLAPYNGTRAGRRHAGASSKDHIAVAYGPNLSPGFQPEGGDDPVRRRELLASAAGLAGAAALGLPATGWARTLTFSGDSLEEVLYGNQNAQPVSLAALRSAAPGLVVVFRQPATTGWPPGFPG